VAVNTYETKNTLELKTEIDFNIDESEGEEVIECTE